MNLEPFVCKADVIPLSYDTPLREAAGPLANGWRQESLPFAIKLLFFPLEEVGAASQPPLGTRL